MTTFNPPYENSNDFANGINNPPVVTFLDKDGNQVTRQEVDDYSAWLEANPPQPVVETPSE